MKPPYTIEQLNSLVTACIQYADDHNEEEFYAGNISGREGVVPDIDSIKRMMEWVAKTDKGILESLGPDKDGVTCFRVGLHARELIRTGGFKSYFKVKARKKSWLSEVQKNLPGQVLGLVLLPISIAITFYVTRYYSAPKPKIQFISALPLTDDAPSGSVRMRIIQDRYLNEFIWKAPALLNSKAAADWLNGFGKWNVECEATFESLVPEFKSKMEKGETLKWNPQQRDEPDVYVVDPGQNRMTWGGQVIQEATSLKTATRLKRVTYYADMWPADKVLAVLDDFSKELQKTKEPDRKRTGDVDFKVTVLNPGASDGVVYRDAVVKVAAGSMTVRAEKNVDIKSHSFAEVTFSTKAQLPEGKPTSVQEAFAQAVKNGESVPIELTLILSDKAVSANATIPPSSVKQTK